MSSLKESIDFKGDSNARKANNISSEKRCFPESSPIPNLGNYDQHNSLLDLDSSVPSSPELKITRDDSMYSMHPLQSDSDEYGVFSDSDKGSVNSDHSKIINEKKTQRRRTGSSTSPLNRAVSARSPDATPTARSRKRNRRKSLKSEMSEKSYRNIDGHLGSGYTSAPATGKVFRNLLIMEECLRQQVIQQRAYRRKYLTFLSILCSLIASIGHHLYFNDSMESNTVLRVILRFTLFALLVTLMLYHLSGEYQKTIVLPRKFLSSTNKGLRQLNVRLVKIKTPFLDKLADLIREMVHFNTVMCLSCLHNVYPSTEGNKESKLETLLMRCQSQCEPRTGITDVKLVLNPRVFLTDIREAWELYRREFWVQEGIRRRARMLEFLREANKEKAIKKERKERKQKKSSSKT